MQQKAYVSSSSPAEHGHDWSLISSNALTGTNGILKIDACGQCHTGADVDLMDMLIEFTKADITNQMKLVISNLTVWANSTNVPAAILANSSTPLMCWDYNINKPWTNFYPSLASDPNWSRLGTNAPILIQSNSLPDNIKQARFNLWLVHNDKTFGVHNNVYVRYLLQVAKAKVDAELNH